MAVEIDEKTQTAKIVPDKPSTKPKRFVVTLWDGDIYILEGFNSVEEITERIKGLEWVRMPNGSQVKQTAISKIQEYKDYSFQTDQKARHKKGQYLGGRDLDTWNDSNGETGKADTKSITGLIQNLPKLTPPQPKVLGSSTP